MFLHIYKVSLSIHGRVGVLLGWKRTYCHEYNALALLEDLMHAYVQYNFKARLDWDKEV